MNCSYVICCFKCLSSGWILIGCQSFYHSSAGKIIIVKEIPSVLEVVELWSIVLGAFNIIKKNVKKKKKKPLSSYIFIYFNILMSVFCQYTAN